METGEGWFYHENIGVLWDFTMKKGETWGPKTILTIKNGIQGREGGVEGTAQTGNWREFYFLIPQIE